MQKGQWNNRSSYVRQTLQGQPSFDDDSSYKGGWQNIRSNAQWVNHVTSADRIELKAGFSSSMGAFDGQTYRQDAVQRNILADNADLSVTQAGNYSHLINDEHSLTVGWDLEWRQRDEKRTVTEKGMPQIAQFEGQPFGARIERTALYLQDEWEISKQWSTYLGVRGERIATRSQGNSASLSNTSNVVTPMWHLNYKLDAAGKDIIRGSITRSYKAPELGSLLARPSLSSLFPDTTKPNTELSPDRIGNPELLPELATGLDLAYEKYLSGGGMVSIGVFYRQVNDLMRSVTSLQAVSYATVPRWVSQPVNFAKAQTAGLELEVKGRVGELAPSLFDPKLPLSVRGSLNYYQSRVDALPGPNNRLDGQQPWSGNLGVDYRFTSVPMTMGGNLAFTPGYSTQQSLSQSLDQGRSRSVDMFAQWVFSRKVSMRVSVNNLFAADNESLALAGGNSSTYTSRIGRTSINAGVDIKL